MANALPVKHALRHNNTGWNLTLNWFFVNLRESCDFPTLPSPTKMNFNPKLCILSSMETEIKLFVLTKLRGVNSYADPFQQQWQNKNWTIFRKRDHRYRRIHSHISSSTLLSQLKSTQPSFYDMSWRSRELHWSYAKDHRRVVTSQEPRDRLPVTMYKQVALLSLMQTENLFCTYTSESICTWNC